MLAPSIHSGPALDRPGELCRTVVGRLTLSNGTPSVRILVAGTRRILGVVQQDRTFDELPPSLRAKWGEGASVSLWDRDLFGRFRVCAVTRERPGWMQRVRIVDADRLRVERTR